MNWNHSKDSFKVALALGIAWLVDWIPSVNGNKATIFLLGILAGALVRNAMVRLGKAM